MPRRLVSMPRRLVTVSRRLIAVPEIGSLVPEIGIHCRRIDSRYRLSGILRPAIDNHCLEFAVKPRSS